VKRVTRRKKDDRRKEERTDKEKETRNDDDDDDGQQDLYHEGHCLHSARLLADDASHQLGHTDVGISLQG